MRNQDFALITTGPLGTLDDYITTVNSMPMLTAEREKELTNQLHTDNAINAARELVLSHLRLVVSISRQYLGYGLPQGDLIQEGNIGLMKAVKRFDPKHGVRLVSFAMHWIKAEINEYVIRNWRLVKIATTKAQRKLFFNLRSMRPDHDRSLSQSDVIGIAQKLNVKPEEVYEMDVRLNGGDVSLESSIDDEQSDYAPIHYLSDDGHHEPSQVLEREHHYQMETQGIQQALEQLDERSRRIIEARWLHDGNPATLHELASEFGVSAERIRQIENAAMKKMKNVLVEF